jgi:hypothetical protein
MGYTEEVAGGWEPWPPAISSLAEHHASLKPFVWTQFHDAILAKQDRLPVPSV